MAGQPNGNGREQMGVRFGGQSATLIVRDVLPVLLLVAASIAGYLVFIVLDRRLEHLREVQVHIIDKLDHHESADGQEQRAVHAWREAQIDYLRRLLITMDYNIGREPADRLPLELLPPPLAPKPPPP